MIRHLTVWGLGAAGLLAAGCADPAHLEGRWTALGRPASAEVYAVTERDARALLEAFPEAMRRVESTMSLGEPDSEMNRINLEAPSGYYRVEDHGLFRCVALALDYAKVTEGTYDPTIGALSRVYEEARPGVPDDAAIERSLEHVDWSRVALERGVFAVHFPSPQIRLDLAGMVDGYALDVAARKFVRAGSLGGVLRLGHQIYAWGRPPGEAYWSVDVTDPRSAEPTPLLRLRLTSGRGIGVSGSGGVADLVLDPRTGRPAASDTIVAVVIADSTADAVAVSRALLVGGSTRAGALLSRTRRVESVLLVRGNPAPYFLASASLHGSLELAGDSLDAPRFLLPPAEL
jgi:thiamine biosynthesis lipoprotein